MSSNAAVDLRTRFEELNLATSRDATTLAAAGKRATLRMLVFSPLAVFLQTYIIDKRWRGGMEGFIAALFAAYEVFVRYAKLWEIHNMEESTPPPHL